MRGPPKALRQRDNRFDFILKRTDFPFFYTVYKFNARPENEVSGPSLY